MSGRDMTGSGMAGDDPYILAGEWVLGLLDEAAARAVEARLAQDAELRAAVAFWRDRLGEIDTTAPPATPDPALWARIAETLDREPPHPAPAPALPRGGAGWRRWWTSLGFWRGTGLAGAAVAAALAVTIVLTPATPVPVAIAVLQAPEAEGAVAGGAPGAIVRAYADGSIDLLPLAEIDVPEGRALQVWTLWDRERGPVSLGVLPRAERVRLSAEGLPRPVPDQLYEITIEQAGGSPTGLPTGPILYLGYAAAAP